MPANARALIKMRQQKFHKALDGCWHALPKFAMTTRSGTMHVQRLGAWMTDGAGPLTIMFGACLRREVGHWNALLSTNSALCQALQKYRLNTEERRWQISQYASTRGCILSLYCRWKQLLSSWGLAEAPGGWDVFDFEIAAVTLIVKLRPCESTGRRARGSQPGPGQPFWG